MACDRPHPIAASGSTAERERRRRAPLRPSGRSSWWRLLVVPEPMCLRSNEGLLNVASNRLLVLAGVATLVASASPVAAHARLVAATPADGATVNAPRTVALTFSERFAAPFSIVEVEDGRGRAVAVTRSVSEDGKTLRGSFATPLAAGTYRVTWAIAATDGHRMTGTYSFTVR